MRDYWDLHAWSIAHTNDFYTMVWDRYGIIGDQGTAPLFDDSAPMYDSAKFMPRAKLNYAENLLLGHRHARSAARLALIGAREPTAEGASPVVESLTWIELYDAVNHLSNALKKLGVKPGVRVCAWSTNTIDSTVAAIATIALGGIFSSCAVDMGPQGVLDRLEQIEPLVLFTVGSYVYGGKTHDISPKLREVIPKLVKRGCRHVVFSSAVKTALPPLGDSLTVKTWTMEQLVEFGRSDAPGEIPFCRQPAMSPLWVLYSSGTTGKPKALIHSAGGMLLHSKIVNDLGSGMNAWDVQLQATTLGWMMYNSTINLLTSGVTIVLYDGSPLATPGILFDIASRTGATSMGVSPKYLTILQKARFSPKEHFDLRNLRQILCAGSPMRVDLYHYIFDHIKHGLFIQNGCGGTDVCGGIISGIPTEPITAPEIQGPILGFALEAWDDNGKSVLGKIGNMVLTKPVPNMPLGLWGEKDNKRYLSTYFNDFLPKIVWNQSDLIVINPVTRGVTVQGRSDAVLNPNGIRFGTAELYECIDAFAESIAVAQRLDNEERVILFVKTPGGREPDADLARRIKTSIKSGLSPRHVPAVILGVPDIPYNASGKKLEVAVRKLISGTALENVNTSACANPEALPAFISARERLHWVRSKM